LPGIFTGVNRKNKGISRKADYLLNSQVQGLSISACDELSRVDFGLKGIII
jgi:hypothetical protein